jgi:hypothetical protein
MPFSSNHKIQIVDASGDACDDDSGKLNVVSYGYDGSSLQYIKTDSDGHLQVDILSALPAGDNNIGNVDIASSVTLTTQTASPSSVGQFTENIGASATQLSTNTCKHVDIMAKTGNVGMVYIGGSGVATTTGIGLYPGDTYSVDISNTNLLYAIADNANDDLQVVYYN